MKINMPKEIEYEVSLYKEGVGSQRSRSSKPKSSLIPLLEGAEAQSKLISLLGHPKTELHWHDTRKVVKADNTGI